MSDRILVLVNGELSADLAGPQIRGWEMARVLASSYDVTVAARVPAGYRQEGIDVVPADRTALVRLVRRHDVLIAPWIPPFLFAAARGTSVKLVADLYDPLDTELADDPKLTRRLRAARQVTDIQLEFADAVLCAAGPQLVRLDERVRSLRAEMPPMLVVPFGLPPPPRSGPMALRKRFGLGADDLVVLWWGTVWRWLDADTALRAIAALGSEHPEVKLVMASGKPADPDAARLDRGEETKKLARSLGLLGSRVHFIDDWIPYDRRQEYLLDADIGLTLHHEGEEARLAARARYMDYLWSGLPCVLARGDATADLLVGTGCARVVTPGDVDEVTQVLLDLADPAVRHRAADAALGLAESMRWDKALTPLLELLDDPGFRDGRRARRKPARVGRVVAGYYARRALDVAHRRRSGAGSA